MSLSLRVSRFDRIEPGTRAQPLGSKRRAGTWAVAFLAGALAPALAAVWSVPWFVTQDGPAHIYNATILAESVGSGGEFGGMSPWHNVFTVRWQPIPNWAASLSLAALAAYLPSWLADRIMTSATMAGFAAAILWLRWRVAGGQGLRVAGLLAAVLSLNMAWIYGFSSFLLGACLFPITLGTWWPARDQLSRSRLAIVAGLLTLGYFCHLVALGVTVVGLVVLAIIAPVERSGDSSWRNRVARTARTCVTTIPVILLGLCYLRIATHRAPLHPVWGNLADPWSLWAWMARLEWVDPLSLAIKDGLPFTEREGWPFIVFAPVIWLGFALFLWASGAMIARLRTERESSRRGWLLLAATLMAGGILGPDSLGMAHGDYLPQRIVLLGLVALVPIIDIDLSTWRGRGVTAALAVALAIQSAIVWDYALYSDRTAGQIIRAHDAVGHGQRIAAVLTTTRSRFRANPLLHAVNWLGVETGNVIWNNYETLHYYFPVQFQPGIDRPRPDDLEWVSIHEDPNDGSVRRRTWGRLLSQHGGAIDVVVVWKSDPVLDAITAQWFEQVEHRGDVQIFAAARRSRSDARFQDGSVTPRRPGT